MSKQANKWDNYSGKNIPSSLDLFPIIFDYINIGSKILDIGCGYGKTVIKLLASGYFEAYGIDINRSGIDFAKNKIEEVNLSEFKSHFKIADALSIPFEDKFFDCIITQAFWTSIMPDERKKVFKEIKRILKKDGILYMAVWDQNWDTPLYKERYENGLKKGLEKGSFEVLNTETGEKTYIAHHYSKEELDNLLSDAGFRHIEYKLEKGKTQHGNIINCHILIAKTYE